MGVELDGLRGKVDDVALETYGRSIPLQSALTAELAGRGGRVLVFARTQLGADRIAGAVAAVAGWGSPVVVVDVGTATTCDLAAAGVREFLFVALPLAIRGATGSMIDPVAVT